MTEMTRHMITAITMPTYSATSSVLGAAGEHTKKETQSETDVVKQILFNNFRPVRLKEQYL